MRYVKWTFWVLSILAVFSLLHYTLPQKDIVRIADTYEKRVDPGENSWFWGSPDAGSAVITNRDVFFIQTIQENGRPMVYRNEDTGWSWPPYFKFDTSNLQAESADLKSTSDDPQWVVIRHYGWRNEFYSIYPNAISVWPVEGPNVTLIPWFNIIFLTVLAFITLSIYFRIRKFKRNRIDPMMEGVGENIDAVGDSATEAWDSVGEKASNASGGFKAILKKWFG